MTLPEDAWDAWVAGEAVPLAPYPAGDMTAHPVSTLVNKPALDDPRCVEPVGARRGFEAPTPAFYNAARRPALRRIAGSNARARPSSLAARLRDAPAIHGETGEHRCRQLRGPEPTNSPR